MAILLVCFVFTGCCFFPEMYFNCTCFQIIIFKTFVHNLLKLFEQIRRGICIEWIGIRRSFVAIMLKCGFSKNILRCFSIRIEVNIVLFQIFSKALIFWCQSSTKRTRINASFSSCNLINALIPALRKASIGCIGRIISIVFLWQIHKRTPVRS